MKNTIWGLTALLALAGCSDFLDPLPNGHYTDENLNEYPSMIRGFVEKSYDLLPTAYTKAEYLYLDGATDDLVITERNHAMRSFALGTGTPASDPFKTYWIRDYQGIMYVNKFLDNDLGLTTRYMINEEQNRMLQKNLQGDAYALRAWWQYDLLRKWGGRGTDGRLLGFPIVLKPVDVFDADAGSFERATYEECVKQILDDCDRALEYLPEANRDWLTTNTNLEGAIRWHRFDQLSVKALKALVYLHRYTPDTIGTLRVDYLHKMQRVYESEINRMQDMMDHSENAREVAAASKRKDKLAKQLKECREYDEKISHLALSRIELDLDDGVKVNYRKLQTAQDGKFYEVLADSKNIMVKEKK